MKNMGKFPCFGSTCNLYDILEFVAQDEQRKIPFDSSFVVSLMIQSQKSVMALKYMHFLDKILTGELSLVRRFYS